MDTSTVMLEPLSLPAEDYERIALAIAFLRQHYQDQPDLKTVAQQVHLSEYHFQRLFTQWAGISPKRFLQYLTVEYAKSKIAETKNLLALSLETGLSGSGRLHDLFVKLEAMTPGEFKTGGAGLQICYGVHNTPFGRAVIATTQKGICNLFFLDVEDETNAEKILRLEWPRAEIIRDHHTTQVICDRVFSPELCTSKQPLTLWVKGTNFQVQIWRALLQIPLGNLTTYQGIAQMICRPTAARAVGNAVGSNPIAYLIPCHRVLRESGELGGYHWGLNRKMAMLGWEASQVNSRSEV